MEDFYNIIISPETIKGDLFTVNLQGNNVGPNYSGETIGIYSGMTQVLTGGNEGSSLLTGLTIPILFKQTAIDVGYFSPFDGAILQKDIVANFIFSSTTSNPYVYNVYNTSSEFQKFLELSSYKINWGDGTPSQTIATYTPNYINHTYPVANAQYTITLEQTNPWGITKVSKTITTPYSDVVVNNPNGMAFFIPAGGNWFETPISYDYIFSGDAVSEVSAQTSNNFTTVPFTVSGLTKSKLNELSMYGPLKFQVGVPVIKNGQIWGAITNTATTFTAYTINSVDYYDYLDGTTIFFQQSSGFTNNNLTNKPITKEEVLLKVIDQPQIQTNVFVERGKNSAYEKIQRLGEVDNLGDMINYGYGFFSVVKNN
jgi:hypothetical protein